MPAPEQQAWAADLPDLVRGLGTDPQQGLSPDEAARRLVADGPNELQRGAEISPLDTPLADRHNRVFLGTAVANGSGRALVVATGMRTEVGGIARLLASATSGETPLQRRLDRVARRLLWACLAIHARAWARHRRARDLFGVAPR